MQSDIMPPSGQPNKKSPRQTMRSNRLRGHSLSGARERLLGIKSFRPSLDDLPRLENEAVAHRPLPINKGSKVPHRWHHWTNRQRIAAGVCSLVLLLAGGGLVYSQFSKKPAPSISNVTMKVEAEPPPKPTTVASPLSGLQISPELAARPVTAIMIENSLDARPQSGLHEAGVVYEAIAEGGITRFIALFQETKPEYVGPVRSLRPYYIDFAAPFDGGIAHVGGSPEALAQIRGGGKDLDQFFNAGSYWRASSRRAPHNVYTSFGRLDALNQKKGYTSSKFTSWPRKEDKAAATPTAKTIDIAISSANYNSRYDYDAASNSYLRSEGGRPHISTSAEADGAGQQLKPKVVVVLVMPYSLSGKYSVYGVNSGGPVYIFQDGEAVEGTWSKSGRTEQFVFKNGAGEAIKLNAGQAWVTAISASNKLTHKP